ncbi:GNAT family N-acetyltransferase (plasmid) [Deinococcus taeanensis]|uniref:GNAT family N-acetyltransferase n=1 Tax=Deinococcus taeanensis TaxID=2737050 RepID=UPI001CDD7D36|nr:GNAT family N-acetyltransferase [Deinococcus taeanensis]UBV44439.1 GNAT family N-acetyltransferase [Deinococcus taeanensis]
MRSLIDQPTTLRECRSITTARYSHPDARIGAHLHATHPALDQQRAWIRRQQAAPDDYYFASCDQASQAIVGVIGLSNISGAEGELGRYTCVNAPAHALEGSLPLQDWALNGLGLDVVYCTFTLDNRTTRLLTRIQNWAQHPALLTDLLTGDPLQRWQTDRERFAGVLPKLRRRLAQVRAAPDEVGA